jgi:hypothetical protein
MIIAKMMAVQVRRPVPGWPAGWIDHHSAGRLTPIFSPSLGLYARVRSFADNIDNKITKPIRSFLPVTGRYLVIIVIGGIIVQNRS